MKEENIARAKEVVFSLNDKREKLRIVQAPLRNEFSVRLNGRNNQGEQYSSTVIGKKELPDYAEEIVLQMIEAHLKRQIATLESELETL